MKNTSAVLIGLLLLFALTFCKKEIKLPTVSIDKIRNVDSGSAILDCTITDDGNGTIISRGVCWSTSESPSVDGDKTIENTDSLSFTSHIHNLLPGTSYYFRAYATNSAGTGYGNTRLLGTAGDKPVILDASDNAYNDSLVFLIKVNPKSLKTNVLIEFGETNQYGNILLLPQSPLYGNQGISLKASLKGLRSGTFYYWRVKASNQKGTVFSKDDYSRTTGDLPSLNDQFSYKYGAKSVTLTTSVYMGNLNTKVVLEWGTSTNYGNSVNTLPNPIPLTSLNSQVTAVLTDLAPKTLYHFRVKATNNAGTATGADHTFISADWLPWAELKTPEVQTKSAILNGRVEPWGLPATVIFEWGKTTEYGNIAPVSITVPDYSQWVDVSTNISGLIPRTYYFYKLKITNEYGTTIREGQFKTSGSEPFSSLKTADAGINEAILNGSVEPGLLSTAVTFEWGKMTLDNSIAATQSPLTGNTQINVSAVLTGLTPETIYLFRVKAENELGISYSQQGSFKTHSVKDADGNFYHTVIIGSQTWFAENLKTRKYSNGDLIGTTDPITKDNSPESTPKYQWAAGGNEINVPLYGRLYTWYAATDNRKICPAGWHVPSDAEMLTLANYAGGVAEAGGRLKEYGTNHWTSPNTGATNSYGFVALPAEGRTIDGTFGNFGDYADFWTNTEFNLSEAWYWNILYVAPYFTNKKIEKNYATSVRCIKD
ncbi:MAG: FISUMP domain-containing protein [Methanosarcina sp.]